MCTRKIEVEINKPDKPDLIWKIPKQMVSIWEKGGKPTMLVKCGKCYECKLERGRNWTYKIWLESLEHKEKCFITLTYKDDENGTKQVNKKEMQDFIKRLRKSIEPKTIKYFLAGEYGEKKGRAHYHIIILGWQPNDLKPMRRKSKKGKPMWTSKTVHELWQKQGIVTVQTFQPSEVGYLTLYIGNNEYLKENQNKKNIIERKLKIKKLQVKHGIRTYYYDPIKKKATYPKIRQIKELNKEELKAYKADYRILDDKLNNKVKIVPEFNLFSKGMGFKSYIKRKYYKYPMMLDGYIYERPKDYLRKIIENKEKYNEEIITHTIYELLARKEYAELNYIDPKDKLKKHLEKTKEINSVAKNKEQIKLHKKNEILF